METVRSDPASIPKIGLKGWQLLSPRSERSAGLGRQEDWARPFKKHFMQLLEFQIVAYAALQPVFGAI
jgi:hypothetical protein